MNKNLQQIKLDNHHLTYTLRKNKRAKNIRLSLDQSGNLSITLPWYLPKLTATTFIKKNKTWILDRLKKINSTPKLKPHTKTQITNLKIKTRDLVRQRLKHFNLHYNLNYHRITIRNQKTRWGSCSSQKTLSFNYKLALLPKELSDYIIVHELCHLKQMNHSKNFWDLVSQTIPNHKQLRKQLNSIPL